MPLLLVVDAQQNRIREYVLDADAQLPGLLHLGCSLRDYCGGTVPEILWAEASLLWALDTLAERTHVPFSVVSGLSFHRSLSFACGEGLTLRPLVPCDYSFLSLALSCGFRKLSPPWHRCNSLDLFCSCQPWVLRPGQCACAVCFLQNALRLLGIPLSVSGRLDSSTCSALRGFRRGHAAAVSLIDRPLLQRFFELTRPKQNATIQIAYGSGGGSHGL